MQYLQIGFRAVHCGRMHIEEVQLNPLLSSLLNSSLTNNQEKFIFKFIRYFNTSYLKTSCPSGNLIFFASIHNFPELINLITAIFVRRITLETIQFLIIVVLNIFTYSSQKALFFADLMLTATF